MFNKKIKFENLNFKNDLYVGIRPEDITFENNSEIELQISVELVENLGSEKIIYTYLNNEEFRIKSSKNVKDKKITIFLPKNKLYLFDNNIKRLKT